MDGEIIPEEAYDLPEYTDDQIEDLLPPSPKRARKSPVSPRLSVPKLYTLKVKYDSRWTKEDYVKITDDLFPDSEKLLVVLEKRVENPHVHFHGYSPYEETYFKKKTNKLKAMHYQNDRTHTGYAPGSRPVQGAGLVATELGFQYLCKEPPNAVAPLYQRGFTPEELMELHAKTQDLVKEPKFNTGDFITSLELPKGDPPAVYQQILMLVAEKLAQEHKDKTRYTRLDIQNGLLHHPQATPKMRGYILSLN